MDLRREFENRDWLQTLGDVEDFLLWVGIDKPVFSNDPKWFKTLPVFKRLGLSFYLKKHTPATYMWQANLWTRKEATFLRRGANITGPRKLGRGDAVLSSLLSLWELETYRKANAARSALGVNNSAKGLYPDHGNEWNAFEGI